MWEFVVVPKINGNEIYSTSNQDQFVQAVDTPVLKWWAFVDEIVLFGGFIDHWEFVDILMSERVSKPI